MTILTKSYVGAMPHATSGTPYQPGTPAWTEYVCTPQERVITLNLSQLEATPGELVIYDNVIATYEFDGEWYLQYLVYDSEVCEFVWHPGSLPVAAVPPSYPTPQQMAYWRNEGWNSHSSSIGSLDPGEYLEFAVPLSSRGALVALDVAGRDGWPIGSFNYGLMFDLSGIYVFEAGIATLLTTHTADIVRVYRSVSGAVMYVANGVAYVSTSSVSRYEPLTVYGMLYAAGDQVTSAQLLSYSVDINLDVRATLSGTGMLMARALSRAELAGLGNLLAVASTAGLFAGTSTLAAQAVLDLLPEAALSGVGYLHAEAETSNGLGTLPLLSAMGGDYAYGIGNGYLPIITMNGMDVPFVPATVTEGYGELPYLVSSGYASDTDIGQGSASLPQVDGIGADYAYGFGSASLPYIITLGQESPYAADHLVLLSGAAMASTHQAQYDLVLVLTSSGTLASSFTMTREQVLSLLSQGNAASYWEVLAAYTLTLLSDGRMGSVQALSVNDRPDLHDNGVVWVVNMSNQASSQYEQYGFNSFFERAGVFYGVGNDGIYKLEGATDNGSLIAALAVLPQTNFGIPKQKRLEAVYLGVASDGAMVLKVDVDGTPIYYTARSYGEMKNHRVDTGKGQIGNYWQFTVMNANGDDFNLAGIEFVPVVLNRRI